jgi:hypothetical protein
VTVIDPLVLDELTDRIARIEKLLIEFIDQQQSDKAKTELSEWVDSREFCRLVSLKDPKQLVYQMSKGIIHGDAIRNIGTAKRPRYRFHRIKAVNQFWNRVS